MATDDVKDWPLAEVLEANHEVTFAELVPEGTLVLDDTSAFQLAIGSVAKANRLFAAGDFTLYSASNPVAEATVLVELPLPNGNAGWSGSGTLVRIPAARRKLIGTRNPDDTFTSVEDGDTDVLAVWTNWHVVHYPRSGAPGVNMSVVMDYAVGRRPVRLSAGDGTAQILASSGTVEDGGSDYALVRIPESDTGPYIDALSRAIDIDLVAHTFNHDIINMDETCIVQVLVGHPLGFAKRLSFASSSLSGGRGPRSGLVRHRCPSYGGSSGGPLMVFLSKLCKARCAMTDAGGPLPEEVSTALVAQRLYERARPPHGWSAVHWGSGGSSCLLRDHFSKSTK